MGVLYWETLEIEWGRRWFCVANETRTKRRYSPRPLVLPPEEVAYEPPPDWHPDVREYLMAYARTGNRTGAYRLIRRSTRWGYWIAERDGIEPVALTEEDN